MPVTGSSTVKPPAGQNARTSIVGVCRRRQYEFEIGARYQSHRAWVSRLRTSEPVGVPV